MRGGYSKLGRTARASLNEAAVRDIRSKAARGMSAPEIGQGYLASTETIRRIIRWETWKWVSEEGEPASVPLPMSFNPEASLKRVIERAGMAPASLPTLADALEHAALHPDTTGVGLEKLQKEAARPDALLAELEGKTDGGKK